MLPIIASGAFTFPQTIDWNVTYYASSMTVPEVGIGFRLGNPTISFTSAGMQAAANPTSYYNTNTTPVLTNSGTWGLVPLVYDYWGTGAPAGITNDRYVAFHYRGFFESATARAWAHPQGTTSSVWLAFSGRGFVRVQLNGTDILNSQLNYSTFVASTLITPNTNDQLDIFYWQNGDDWGGITGSYVVQQNGQGSATSNITVAQYGSASPIAGSLAPWATASPITLQQIADVDIEYPGPMDTMTMKFNVPLSTPDTPVGWKIINSPRRLQFTDTSGGVTTLKRRQLVTFSGGFAGEQYQRFAGNIVNFNENDGVVTVECAGFEDRMTKVNVQNFPDPISYDAFGFFKTYSTSQPIYGIPAYDNWPLEFAIKDLCFRGGLDPRLFYGVRQVNNVNGTITNMTDLTNNPQYFYRAKTVGQTLLKLQRPALYGNAAAGFDPTKPPDDQYIYRPNAARSCLDWARELADALGYDFRSNSLGYMQLWPRYNPQRFTKVTGGTQAFSPTALGGTYQQFGPSNFSTSITYTGSRVDLLAGIGTGLGQINYNVTIMSGTQVASGTIDLSIGAYNPQIFFYDEILNAAGQNAAAIELYSGPWGTYTVNIANKAGTSWYLDSIVVYDVDPTVSSLPTSLATDQALEALRTQSLATEAVNRTLVIGKRKADITDSEKDRNPNNPQYEYWVAEAVDPSSIYDPTATNYTGGAISSIIVDDKISDQDYANWAAEALLIRQRDPGPSADITNTILPFLEPRDPITIVDKSFSSITASTVVWITGVTEKYGIAEATSEIKTTAYPQIPSYEPRQDLPVATIDSTFFGQPIINFSITYPSIDSGTILNPGPGLQFASTWDKIMTGRASYLQTDSRLSSFGSDAQGTYILMSGTSAWPPIAESISIGPDHPNAQTTITGERRDAEYYTLVNNPYMKFTHIFDYTSKKVYLPCLAGDGSNPYTLSGWGMGTSAFIAYKGIFSGVAVANIYSGTSPFYDPYMSELPDGNLITVQFDSLVSGYYRVSVWDARDRTNPTLIAWLTQPDKDPTNQDIHWQYTTSGRSKQFFWDGVDNLGSWNERQSNNYSWIARGWFEQADKPEVGKGFYAWNDQSSEIVAISGQTLGGKLTFIPDHYCQFYVKVEVLNDAFGTTYETGTNIGTPIRITSSDNLLGVSAGQNAKSKMYIYTHLPKPTTVNITGIEDWNPLAKAYDQYNDPYTGIGWTTLVSGIGDYAASIRNDKPIRITLTANARPGGRFSGNHNYTSMKVHRVSHLNANFMDITTVFEGEPWTSFTGVEKKRVLSRRLTNNTFTLDFNDTDWRTGDTLDQPQNKWIFRPQDFVININRAPTPLNYCDYLQLEEVPGFSAARVPGQKRSRMLLAYLNYIFYLSVFVQDRSGRMTWAIDPTDIDRSKIVKNTFTVEQPENLDAYAVRTIMARQWVEPSYTQTLASQWNIASGIATDYLQFFHNRLAHNDSDNTKVLRLDSNAGTVTGRLNSTTFTDFTASDWVGGHRVPPDWITTRQLGSFSTPSFFGKWTWEGNTNPGNATLVGNPEDIFWAPDLTRDFHPFGLIPPMIWQGDDIQVSNNHPYFLSDIVNRNWAATTSVDRTSTYNYQDQAVNDSWFSTVYSMNNTGLYPNGQGHLAMAPGHTVEATLGINQNANTPYPPDYINYQKTIEHLHWEQFRGVITEGRLPTLNLIAVSPSAGAYLMNLYKYRDLTRINRVQFVGGQNTPAGTLPVFDNVESQYFFIIATTSSFLENELDNSEGWWSWTFRSKYTWYSDSYFPINAYGRLFPRYIHPKYQVVSWGSPSAFDSGAWVGWKDDHDPNSLGYGLTWRDHTTVDVTHHPLNGANGITNATNNIFITNNAFGLGGEIDRPPLAIGPKLNTSKDVIISLALVNSRRTVPIGS